MTDIQTINATHRNEEESYDFLSEECFQIHLNHYDHLPWLQALKRAAWKEFHSLPLPMRTNEKWRFSNLKKLTLEGFQFPHTKIGYERVDIARLSSIIPDYAGRMIFEDNHLLRHDYISDSLQSQGVIWQPLCDAFENHPELVQKYFAQQKTHLGSEKFYYLNLAYAHAGSFLYVPKDVIIEEPLLAYHWAQVSGVALIPQTIIVAEPRSRVSLIDIYASHLAASPPPSLAIAMSSIFAGKNAYVSRTSIQNWNEATLSFQLDSTITSESAHTKSVAINLGSSMSRFENQVVLDGPHAQAELLSLAVANDAQEFDQRTFQEHYAAYTTSNLLYKNALLDTSHTIFSGMIKVHPEADKTDAYQTNHNLLLSEDAVASSLPGLEIEANDVKCSHGATSGKLDENELFYMLSRGISKKAAQQLLIFGFLEEILEKIENPLLRDDLRERIQQKLHAHTAVSDKIK